MSAVPKVSFIDRIVPAVKAGNYKIEVKQLVSSGDKIPAKEYRAAQQFSVDAPRYSIDPSFVHSVYPPAGSVDDYGRVLPSIVLNRAVLPWERPVEGRTTAPWVALLVFAKEEIVECRTAPISDFEKTDSKQTCQVVKVRASTLRSRVVRALIDDFYRDQELLAHVRETADGGTQERHAVVIGSRVPIAGDAGGPAVAYEAHLVSLVDVRGLTTMDTSTIAKDSIVEFVSLWSWGFSSGHSSEVRSGFPRAMKQLITNSMSKDSADSQLLRLQEAPPGPAREYTGNDVVRDTRARLQSGYVALSYWLQSGKKTFAWYRGPFSPHPPQDLDAATARILSSSHALIYVQAYGVLDVSVATAWNLGRALALTDSLFCRSVVSLRAAEQANNNSSGEGSILDLGDTVLGAEDLLNTFDISQVFTSTPDASQLIQSADPPVAVAVAVEARDPGAGDLDVEMSDELGADGAVSPVPGEDRSVVDKMITGLSHLEGVPFSYLVPDARMLPPENFRFFRVDTGWVYALIQGALSVGVSHDHEMRTDGETVAFYADKIPRAGMLIRSHAVASWPDLVVQANPGVSTVVRKLSADVLLCLFDKVPTEVSLSEPHKQMNFGVDLPSNTQTTSGSDSGLKTSVINLRSLKSGDSTGTSTGNSFPLSDGSFEKDSTVLKIHELATTIAARSDIDKPPSETKLLSSAQLAVQLMNLPYRQVFSSKSGSPA